MPSRDIRDAVQKLQDAWPLILKDYEAVRPGFTLQLTCVYRSPEEQLELFKKGRTLGSDGKWYVLDKNKIVTNADGKTLSPHNYRPARGIDVVVIDKSTRQQTWNEKQYQPLIAIAANHDLESGGTWKTIKDWPHIQVKDYKNYEA